MRRHFISFADLDKQAIERILCRAAILKKHPIQETLSHKTLVMIFEKASTRTRLSFEVGMYQLNGKAIPLVAHETQLGRGETVADTARVLSRMADIIVYRTKSHQNLIEFATFSAVPIINGLSDQEHPCQLLADILTYQEHRGSIQGKKVVWLGDINNMCKSYIVASKLLQFKLTIACPEFYVEEQDYAKHTQNIIFETNPKIAISDADLVVTDVWISMGQEDESERRLQQFRPYQVNDTLLKSAKPDAVFMHCLPAQRGYEVTDAVLDGKQSVVWDEAENRLHAQKALLEFLLHVEI